ncbi:hypothetical protein OKHIF_09390 [Mycobacteroides chelonae]|jgi:hypothetical protein
MAEDVHPVRAEFGWEWQPDTNGELSPFVVRRDVSENCVGEPSGMASSADPKQFPDIHDAPPDDAIWGPS